MNTPQQIAAYIFILWCGFPLLLVVATKFLIMRRKYTLVSSAATVGFASFFITFLIMVAGIADNFKPDNPWSWLAPPIVGIVFFLVAFPSWHFIIAIKGYDSFADYHEGEQRKTMLRIETLKHTDWKQRLKDWARRMWEGNYP